MNKNEINGLCIEEFIMPGHEGDPGCGKTLAVRLALKAAGQNTIVVNSSEAIKCTAKNEVKPSWKIPFIHTTECPASLALGIETSMKQGNKIYNILVFVDEQSTNGKKKEELHVLSKYDSRICYVFLDSEGELEDYCPSLKYVASTSVAFPLDIVNKIRKGLESNCPSFIRIFSPTPKNGGFDKSKTIQVAKEAFNTKLTPVYEVRNGCITSMEKPSKESEIRGFLSLSGKKMNKKEIDQYKEEVDKRFESLIERYEKQGKPEGN